jgi:hypothetical protein
MFAKELTSRNSLFGTLKFMLMISRLRFLLLMVVVLIATSSCRILKPCDCPRFEIKETEE